MGQTYREWVHEVDLSYHMLGLRHALILKDLQRRKEENCEDTCSPPEAKRQPANMKIMGRVRSSTDSHMSVPWEKGRATGEMMGPNEGVVIRSRTAGILKVGMQVAPSSLTKAPVFDRGRSYGVFSGCI